MSCEEYLAKVKQLIATIGEQLTSDEIAEVDHLVNHGEPAEGLRTLAWIIHDGKKSVSPDLVNAIFELTEGQIEEDHLPPNFRQYADSFKDN